jgi:hypothetical protein
MKSLENLGGFQKGASKSPFQEGNHGVSCFLISTHPTKPIPFGSRTA